MKFDKAYCVELDEVVTPYKAREYHFNEQSDWYLEKLSFRCEDVHCRVELTPVNVYSVKRIQMPLHFRTWKFRKHTRECSIVKSGAAKAGVQGDGGRLLKAKEAAFKPSYIPNVFLLERPAADAIKGTDRGASGTSRVGLTRSPYRRSEASGGRRDESSEHVTSYLEHVVDCYNSMTTEDRRRHSLRIENVRLSYEKIFKRIIYFKDGPGLIYYGVISELRNFGGDYRIKFRDLIWEKDGRRIRMSIYLKKALIDDYRRSRLFRQTLQEMSTADGEIVCYFVGAYPRLKKVPRVVGGVETEFEAYEVEVTNLDHLVVTFASI